MSDYDQIKELADGIQNDLVACRRDFHKYAETGWLEMRTSSIIARKLTELGYEVLTGDQVCKKDARTYFIRSITCPSCSTLIYNPSIRSELSVSRHWRSGSRPSRILV